MSSTRITARDLQEGYGRAKLAIRDCKSAAVLAG